ncbi:MAG: hypothetical protein KJ792_10950 [Actinobacteria bacterium]|nr:hypothetical protein [Actinomycetota bacterium]MCG2803701.1 hypothetical protein [Cellulomonas sp.]
MPTGEVAESGRRRRWILAVVIVVLVLVVGGAVWGVLHAGGTPTATSSTVLIPSPTPTVEPVARTATSTFAAALPTTVLQFALASSAADDAWVAKGALEAYAETFADGSGATLGLQVGQWVTPQETTAVFGAITAAAPTSPASSPATASSTATAGTDGLPRSGSVEVGGQATGSYLIVDNGDGTGTATWTNGTALLQLTGPVAEIARLYAAFPL